MRTTLAILLALGLFAATANAAVVTVSTTAPTVDADDIANLGPGTANQKWFHDIEHDAGQTFTPSADLQLNSFSFQLDAGNEADASPDEYMLLRIGTITRPGGVFTFTDVYSEEAHWTMDWFAGDWVTVTLDVPFAMNAGVEYGVITDAQRMGDWHVGIPYRERTGNVYAGGHLINRGGATTNSDLVFEADMSTAGVPEPASLALFGLGGLMMLRRRSA